MFKITITEINREGNYDSWSAGKRSELKHGTFGEDLGKMLYENVEMKLSEILLKPHERIPFKRLSNNFSFTSFTEGLLLSRNGNGQIVLVRIRKGGMFFWESKGKEGIYDLENIGENVVRIAIVEEKRKTK